jgi:hypothetical protein
MRAPADADTKTTYAVILSAKPSPAPAIIRLRRLLKIALRAFALECIDVKEITTTAPESAPHCTPCNAISLDITTCSNPRRTNGEINHE